jgi:hypothetical protein
MNSVREAYVIHRYDYDGNLLCEFDVRGIPQTILELEDGGFVAFAASDTDGLYAITCYDKAGNLRWKYVPEEDGSKYIPFMYERNGDVYCFGEVKPKNQSSDILIWRISREGELSQKIRIGGSDFDDIHRVLETEMGFEILGSTQSGDGDLPFSQDGHGVDFRLEINIDLELISKEKYENRFDSKVGYHDGRPVFEDDELLKITRKDRFQEGMGHYINGMFDWEEGYVVIRTIKHDIYTFDNPLLSRLGYYDQIVITGYDSKGNPQWQLAGNVRAG